MSVPGFMPQFSCGGGGGITYVDGVTGSAIDGNNVTLTLSGIVGLAEDDIVVIFGGFDRNAAPAMPAGWTTIFNYWAGDHRLMSCYKIMGASPDTSVTMPGSGDSRDATTYVASAFRGVDTTTPMDATPVMDEDLTATAPATPPQITTVTANAMLVVGLLVRAQDDTFTVPTGYAAKAYGENLVAAVDFRSSTACQTYKVAASTGVQTPGGFTDFDLALRTPITQTVALRPA